jgi:hypothetical protein
MFRKNQLSPIKKGDICLIILLTLLLLSLPYLARAPIGFMASWYELGMKYLCLPLIIINGFLGLTMYLMALGKEPRGAEIKALGVIALILIYVMLKVVIF